MRAFADATAHYLRGVERFLDVQIVRVAIDAPSDPKVSGSQRRAVCRRFRVNIDVSIEVEHDP